MVAVHEVEWGDSSQNMDSVIVGELSHGYPLHPVILVVAEECLKVLLEFLVDVLHLPIHLWIEGHQGIVLESEGGIEHSHELGLELGSLIMDDLVRHVVGLEELVPEYLGHSLGSECCMGQLSMHLL